MKKIEAIVRKTKFEEVKEALHENGIEFFSFWEARGVGMARESRVYRGIAIRYQQHRKALPANRCT